VAIQRTRKQKETPHYGFLVSWEPPEARVKGELESSEKLKASQTVQPKNAINKAQAGSNRDIKKDIVRSLAIVGFILILELVVYLAWIKFGLS
jgi:hypothetical protein